mgnify:CR=1 FL=1
MKKLVSDLMVDYLERRGVEYIFGLCGHTVIGFLDALSRSEKIKYISVAPMFAEAIERIYQEISIAKLFN